MVTEQQMDRLCGQRVTVFAEMFSGMFVNGKLEKDIYGNFVIVNENSEACINPYHVVVIDDKTIYVK